LAISYQRLALYKFILILLLVSHWLACLWSMSLILGSESGPQWVDAFDDMEADAAEKTRDSLMMLYVAALYFTSYTITSVGYGDIGPKNLVERIVCICMIFVAGIVWTYVLGQVCGIMSSMGKYEAEFRKTMDDLNDMMSDRGLPPNMRQRLRNFFLSTKGMNVQSHHKGLLRKMSPALRGEVALAINTPWLRKVTFMTDFVDEADRAVVHEDRSPSFLVDMATSLESAIFAQSELFGRPRVLYILQKGLISRRMKICSAGAVWGEDFLLSPKELCERVLCNALTYVEVSFLDRDRFMSIVERYKLSYPQLAYRVRRFLVRLAGRRGIILEAARRQKDLNVKFHQRVGRWLSTDLDPMPYEGGEF